MKKVARWTGVVAVCLVACVVGMAGFFLMSNWDNQAKTAQTTIHLKNLRLGQPEEVSNLCFVDTSDIAKELPVSLTTWVHQNGGAIEVYIEQPNRWLKASVENHPSLYSYQLLDFNRQGDDLNITWYEPMSPLKWLALMGIGLIALVILATGLSLAEEIGDASEKISQPVCGTA